MIKYVDALPRSDVTCLCIVCMYGRAELLAAAVDAGSGLIDVHMCCVVDHAWVACVASTVLMLGLATGADLASLICGTEQIYT